MKNCTTNTKRTLAMLILAALLVILFHNNAHQYEYFRIPHGYNSYNINTLELAFYLWYLVLGVPFVALCTSIGRMNPEIIQRWRNAILKGLTRKYTAIIVILGIFVTCVAAFAFLTQGAPIADDEETYSFIARTLRLGRLTNPVPQDAGFYDHPMTVISTGGWYGKYPIGHSIFLAAGQLLRAEWLVGPLAITLTAVLFRQLALSMGNLIMANLLCFLMLISPHFILMGTTRLSQTTSTLFLAAGLLLTSRLTRNRSGYWALAAGTAWGVGILIRPLPGILFLAAALFWILLNTSTIKQRAQQIITVGGIACIFVAIVFGINALQTGDPLVSGYHTSAGTGRIHLFGYHHGIMTSSVIAGLLRQNFWLLGWPISLALLPFAWPCRWRQSPESLLWLIIAAAYAYRIISPKTVVATFGPVYLTEIVPVMLLLSVCALRNLCAHIELPQPFRFITIPSFLMASTLASLLFFLPFQISNIHRNAVIWNTPINQVQQLMPPDKKALIFSRSMYDLDQHVSWAYLPPHPTPDHSERLLFVRLPKQDDWLAQCLLFQQRNHPERIPFALVFIDGKSQLIRLKVPDSASNHKR